ncbi:MAG TPA: oligopeptide/dipeptide ABC transporter ATP-binding protein [Stellaceae bacterium]|jgi:peptide/nickel transport system ATP-binding protein
MSATAAAAASTAPLLDVRGLARHYHLRPASFFGGRPVLKAVDGVDFAVAPGSIFGIVGESGCGKSTLGRLVMALDRPTGGRVLFEGEDLLALPARALARRRRGFQMVFQDPYGSLDPRQRVRTIVGEPLHLDSAAAGNRALWRERVGEALAGVGLSPADAEKYPHEFSGGQRQRIAIARALATRPKLIVADEPVSALDLSVQAQVLNLLLDLRDRHGLALLFISHNLAVVEHVADRVAVMYRGRFVETGAASEVLHRPLHPYTRLLLDAEPNLDAPRRLRRRTAAAAPQPAVAAPESTGCSFAPRCPLAVERCRAEAPILRGLGVDRAAACHRAGETA